MSDKPVDLTKPVRTESGLKVRILCTDLANPSFPVVGAIMFTNGCEKVYNWSAEGEHKLFTRYKLVNVPERVSAYGPVVGQRHNLCDLEEAKKRFGQGLLEYVFEDNVLVEVKLVEKVVRYDQCYER